jgi:hypothetical protein
MARTGLRMMPTLYGGFSPVRLQGWRISGRLPANGAHVSRPLGLLPAFVPTAASVDSPLSVGVRCAHKHRHSSGYAALPQEPSLRSGFLSRSIHTYPAPSDPLAGTARFHCAAAYTPCLRCTLPPRPRLVPCFRCSFFLNMSPSATPGSPAAVCTQFLHRQRWPSSL